MKKLYIILALAGILIGSQTIAAVVTTTRKINKTNQTQTQSYTQNKTTTPVTKRTTGNKLVDNVKTCTPYSETMVTDVSGVNFSFKVSINGWKNNKCYLNFISDTKGIASSFENIYGVSASQADIYAFAPKVQCAFTKQQLEYVGDSILEENARKNGGKMLKNPSDISLGKLSSSDTKLLDVIMNDKACTILNANDLENMMQSILGL